jgi:hypothetical protein
VERLGVEDDRRRHGHVRVRVHVDVAQALQARGAPRSAQPRALRARRVRASAYKEGRAARPRTKRGDRALVVGGGGRKGNLGVAQDGNLRADVHVLDELRSAARAVSARRRKRAVSAGGRRPRVREPPRSGRCAARRCGAGRGAPASRRGG